MTGLNDLNLQKIKDFLSDKKKRLYVFLAAIAVGTGLYLTLFIFPLFGRLAEVSGKVKEVSEKIDFINNSIVMMSHRKDLMRKLEGELDSYAGGFPHEKEISDFLQKLSSIAKSSGVKILTITPSDLKPVDQGKKEVYYYEMPVLITAKSGYHELGGFIAEIETEKRFITIEGLKLEYNKSTPLRHNVNMTLKTYVSVDEDDV